MLLISLIQTALASNSIRGISPQQINDYLPDESGFFSCLSDPSIKIPFSRVNDNYCDCPDGSDEPGTSACSNGKFYCPGMDTFIPSRYVDDGNCDYYVCCDGSDEKPGVCGNKCDEVHAVLKRIEQNKLEQLNEAREIHKKMVSDSKDLKEQLASEIKALQLENRDVAKQIRSERIKLNNELTNSRDAAPDPESMKILKSVHESLTKMQQDYNTVRDQLERLTSAYNNLNNALEKMSVDYNPNFNDPAVKSAIKVWQETPRVSVQPLVPVDLSEQLNGIANVKVESVGGRESSLKQLVSNVFGFFTGNHNKPQFVGDDNTADTADNQERVNTNDSDTVAVQAIKSTINRLIGVSKSLDKKLKVKQVLYNLDDTFWGPDEIGRSAESRCLKIQKGDFIYRICLFGSAVQLNGRNRAQLGVSQGLKMRDETAIFNFIGGDSCDNGQNRDLSVIMTCGSVDELDSINEVDLCSYVARGKSPMACVPNAEEVHNEL